MTSFLLLSVGDSLLSGNSLRGRIAASFMYVLALICTVCLCKTYSRGGWLAFASSGMVYALIAPRRLPVLLLLSCGAAYIVCLLPIGLGRVSTILGASSDLSIGHRLTVWRGALAMINDHLLSGVPSHTFRTAFSAWYKPLNLKEEYFAALNDGLTIGAEWGILAFFSYYCIISSLICAATTLASRTSQPVLTGLIAGLVCQVIGGCFTYCFASPSVIILFSLFCFAILLFIVLTVVRRDLTLHDLRRATLFGCAVALLLTGFVLVAGSSFVNKRRTKVTWVTAGSDSTNPRGVKVEPVAGKKLGTVLYLLNEGETVVGCARGILRPLAQAGYETYCFDLHVGGIEGLTQSSKILEWIQRVPDVRTFHLLGVGVGGQMAILNACLPMATRSPVGVICVNAPIDSPFERLSPLDQIGSINCPLLLIYSNEMGVYSGDDAFRLLEGGRQGGKRISLKKVPEFTEDPLETGSLVATVLLSLSSGY